ncbi:MAG: T9SS type A sorting domain-containing protein [Opitutaceae bacterium]|nr:T9SS type A sorting domain-containing protein [Cytophagales bacterium]
MKKLSLITKYIVLVLLWFPVLTIQAQRRMERLDRGLVAVKTSNGVFLSWRVFGTDPKNVAFNIYRNGTKVNASPITGATNITDAAGAATSAYTVKAIINGAEQTQADAATVWASQIKTVNLPNRPSANHAPNDIMVGDLDGDGQYDLIVKWYPANAKDNSQSGVTDNTFLGAYQLDGTPMWMIDLGKNIRSGAHYVQVLVGDYDSDGKAELACKTAPNTKDGTGKYLSKGPAATDDDGADYRNSDGYVLSGPEHLTIFNGQTGAEMATIPYVPARGNVGSWGDTYGNRLDRYNATNAYLDGVKPSMVFQRGYYTRMTMMALDWDGKKLITKWLFDSNNPASSKAYGQGNHNTMCADVDNDGFDEILTGAACIDHDGTLKWTTGFGHGDANHVGDFDISSPGLEVWEVNEETGSQPDHYMIRASDGHVLWRAGGGHDDGRGMTGDIDASQPGSEVWSATVANTFTSTGTSISTAKPSMNFRAYWDGDLQDELLDGNKLDKWNGNGTTRLLTLTGQACNGTKSTPNISADLFGDWREEVILHDGASKLYIHTTTISTQYKLYTLMHDPVYRNLVSSQQSSYNQPPHLGFFLGAGVDKAPTPNIVLVGNGTITGINDENSFLEQSGLVLSPNPFTEDLYLRASEEFDYIMYDLKGVEMEQGHGQNVYYAGSTLKSGMYIVKIKSASGGKVFKVTKN